MTKRKKFIDIARAFAIIFIVLGHTIVHSEHCMPIFKMLYSFHVVLFFILSGYTFKINNKSFKDFLTDKFKRIMVPYFVWAILFIMPYLLFGNKVGQAVGTNSSFYLKDIIINTLYGNGNLESLKQNSALWFLPALFCTEIIFYFIINKEEKNNNSRRSIITLVTIILINYLTSKYLNIIFPWGINTVLNIGCFFYIGYCLNKYNIILNKKSNILRIIFYTIIGLISCFSNKYNVLCIEYSYGSFLLMLISGYCLSMTIIYLSLLINNNKILEYIGKNTLGILVFHKPLIIIFQTKLGSISKMLINSNLFVEMFIGIIVTALSIALSVFITEIIRKKFPILIGEKAIKLSSI